MRKQGALLLLGPLDLGQWNDVFDYLRKTAWPRMQARGAAGLIDREFARSAEAGLCDNELYHLRNRRLRPAQLWSTKTPRRHAS